MMRRDPHTPLNKQEQDSSDDDTDSDTAVPLSPVSLADSMGTIIIEVGDEMVVDGEDLTVVASGPTGVTLIDEDGTTTIISLQAAREAMAEEID